MERDSEAKMEKRDTMAGREINCQMERGRDRHSSRHTALPAERGDTQGQVGRNAPLPHDLLLGTPAVVASPPSALPPSLLLLAKPIKLLLWPQLKVPRLGEETTEEASLLCSTPNHQLILTREGYSLPKDPHRSSDGGKSPPP